MDLDELGIPYHILSCGMCGSELALLLVVRQDPETIWNFKVNCPFCDHDYNGSPITEVHGDVSIEDIKGLNVVSSSLVNDIVQIEVRKS